jgi:hypothetical protein
MNEVEAFILEKSTKQRELMTYFHFILTEDYHLSPKLKFNIPFYYGRSWVLYLSPKKDEKVEVVFIKGFLFSKNFELLEARGRKQVRGALFSEIEEVPERELREIIEEALKIDKS